MPNNFLGGDGLNTALFTFAAQQNESQLEQTFKIDHVLNEKNTVFARYSWGFQNSNCDAVNGGLPWFPGGPCVLNTKRDPKNLAVNWRTNPTARITNELVFGFNRLAFDFADPTTDLNGIQIESPSVTWPEILSAGNKRELTTWQLVDNWSWVRGAHSIKAGINFRWQSHQDLRGSIGGQNAVQSVNFSRLINTVDGATFGIPPDINAAFDRAPLESNINFLLGRVGSTGRGFVSRGDQFVAGLYDFTARFNEYDVYLQDTWKVARNVTVDVGLRWEIKAAPQSSPAGRIRRPNALMTAGAPPANAVRWETGAIYSTDYHNWAPSVGFSWDPFGKGKTAVRANYRIAFDRINTFVLSSSVSQNLPGQVQGVVNQAYGQAGGRLTGLPVLGPPTIRPSELAQPPAFSLNNITVVDPAFETPTTHGWSLSLQQEVARNTVLEVNCIGRCAYNLFGLFGAYNSNQTEVFRNGFL